jgi:NAD(P)-dependent dehydrogenase (short-subunit alcohol dehydrogenase family)
MKKVLITGVLGGIGSGLAKIFNESGYYVIGLDIKDQKSSWCNLFLQFDIQQYCENHAYRTKMNSIFDLHVSELDVLVNNAAVQILGSLEEIKIEDWNHTLSVNLTGPMLLSQFFLTRLERVNGCIINISSIHHKLTKKRFIAYATSKSALIGLTKAMSVDFQGRVRVNSISPAAIDTPMLLDGFDNNQKMVDELKKIHPIQRIGKPEEVSRLALLLAESELGFINGANIGIDGGIGNVLKDID